MARKRIDITGQRFGKLTVIRYNEKEGKWLCQCDCGEQKLILQRSLSSGNTKSCGCGMGKSDTKVNDLTGKKFGRLTVVKRATNYKQKVMWECLCECGVSKNVRSDSLTDGTTLSCGCLKAEKHFRKLSKGYEEKRIEGVAMQLFKGQEPRKDSSTGYRGVSKYYTSKSKQLRYRAWITVAGKKYYKAGFLTPEDAYYNGRLELEQKHLPKGEYDNGN